LDLRNNPGGLLDSAVKVASQFLDRGNVTKIIDNKGDSSTLSVQSGGVATKLPVVVLVNGGSASASEIVAGALQDYSRAKIIGVQTYGKGSVQMIRGLSDGSTIHVTIARWYTPNGHQIDSVGIKPDIVSELEDDQLIKLGIDTLKANTAAK
jgi:carboxyl-terminal processing protease